MVVLILLGRRPMWRLTPLKKLIWAKHKNLTYQEYCKTHTDNLLNIKEIQWFVFFHIQGYSADWSFSFGMYKVNTKIMKIIIYIISIEMQITRNMKYTSEAVLERFVLSSVWKVDRSVQSDLFARELWWTVYRTISGLTLHTCPTQVWQ